MQLDPPPVDLPGELLRAVAVSARQLNTTVVAVSHRGGGPAAHRWLPEAHSLGPVQPLLRLSRRFKAWCRWCFDC